MTSRKILKKAGQFVLYISVIVLVLLVSFIIFIQSAPGKRFARNQFQHFLSEKLKTTVTIGSVDYSFPKWLELKEVYMEDLRKDTLLYGRKLSVDLDMYKLLRGDVDIRKIELQDIQAHLGRSPTDSNFNFQFILDAFSPGEAGGATATTTTAFQLSLKRLLLQRVSLKFTDNYAGNFFSSSIGNLDLTMHTFQPGKWLYDIEAVAADSLHFTLEISEPGSRPLIPHSLSAAYYPVRVNAGKSVFKKVYISIHDRVSGMKYANHLQYLSGTDLAIDLQKHFVGFGDLQLDSSRVHFEAGRNDTGRHGSGKALWKVEAGRIALRENEFAYDDNQATRRVGLDYSHLHASGVNLEADHIFYSPDSSSASLKQLSFREKGGFQLDSARAILQLTNHSFVADQLYVKTPGSILRDNVELRFSDLGSILNRPFATQVNARLLNSTVSLDELYQVAPFVKQYLDPSRFQHAIFHLDTELYGSLQQLYFPNLQLASFNGTVINARGIVYNVTAPETLSYDIMLFNSAIPRADMAQFIPANNKHLTASLPATVRFGGRLQGDLTSTRSTATIRSDELDFDGTIRLTDLASPTKFRYDVQVNNTRIQKAVLLSMIDTSLIPGNFRLPEVLVATGTFSGNKNELRTNLKTGGSYGSLSANGFVKNIKDPERAVYDLQLSGDNFSVGSLLNQDTLLDKITFNALLRGRGFNYKTMQGAVRGDVANLGYNQYNYKNIAVNADFNKGHIASTGKIEDSSLRLAYQLTTDVNAAHPSVSASVKLDTVLLKNLYFFKDTMNFSFSGIFRAENLDPYNLSVYALFDSGRVFYKNRSFRLDSIFATARTVDQQTSVRVRSSIIDADANGRFAYKSIGPAIIQYIDHYYNISDSLQTDYGDQQISFNGEVKSHPLFAELIPGLTRFENATFTGSYASDHGDSAFNLAIHTPFAQYKTSSIRNMGLNLNSRNRTLEYTASFDTISRGKRTLIKTAIHGAVANDTIALIAEAFDDKDVPRYSVGATLYAQDKMFSLTISDSILLNYKKWDVSPKNNINYSRLGLLVTDFVLTNDSSSISAVSQQNIPNSAIDIAIDNFDIRDITALLRQDTLLAEGLINARLNVSDFDKKLPAFTGTASVNGLKINQAIVGNIELSAGRHSENRINGSMQLSENNNDVAVNGYYCLDEEEQQFDASVDLKKLSLATLQGFSNGYMSRASGAISGLLDVGGKFTRPEWKGALNFESARFTVERFGTTYSLNKETIVFDYPAICFDNFTIRDTLNNPLIINGDILSRNLFEYDLALDLKSQDFTLVSAPKAINNLIYGFAAMNMNVSVSGTSEEPDLAGDVYLTGKSDLTLVLPEKNIDKDAARSLVRFIDADTFALPEMREFRPVAAPATNFKSFVNSKLNLQVGKEAGLTIVIDPSSGDELKIQGGAHLNPGVDPGGNLILAGDYLIDSGFYVLNYQFLSKRFELKKGSSIHFTGEPVEAQINMTAEYIANTSPRELLGNEVGSVDPKFAYSFNQKIPFRVILYMKGSLKKPMISFDIRLPSEGTISKNMRTTINNKLVQLRDDVAATNKQVFALLALDRFVGEQSTDFFKGSGTGDFNDLGRESVSKFLSDALDQIASDLFKGINIDLNLNSYKDFTNSDAQRPDLSVEVSKNFLNDRLHVTVGKNFGIEGQDGSAKAAQQKGSRFLPDVTVTRKLSQDGKYKMRAYNKNQFEVILDGYVVETGLGFIITMDYDKYQELFVKKKEEKK